MNVSAETIESFCRKWEISELALFGSRVRGDSGDTSDLDVLVELGRPENLSLFDWMDMRDELESIFGCPVDLVSKRGLRNPIRKREILASRQVIYAA